MDKQTIKRKLAAMIAASKTIPIHLIHNAGGSFCVSGDRRLRELRDEWYAAFPDIIDKRAYTYDPIKPKVYIFYTQFREWVKWKYTFIEIPRPKADVRVQIPLEPTMGTGMIDRALSKSCPYCGAVIHYSGKRRNKVYCSPKCRVAAWRLRK